MGKEAEFFVGPPPTDDKLPPKPAPKPDRTSQIAQEIIMGGTRSVDQREDDPASLLQGLLGAFPGMSSEQAAEMRSAAMTASHNAVVEGKRIQKRAEKAVRRKHGGRPPKRERR
jgi:hypothetical protein